MRGLDVDIGGKVGKIGEQNGGLAIELAFSVSADALNARSIASVPIVPPTSTSSPLTAAPPPGSRPAARTPPRPG